MTQIARKRNRKKTRNVQRKRVFAAAKLTYETSNSKPFPWRFFDGRLVHLVLKDMRTFNLSAVPVAQVLTAEGFNLTPDDWQTHLVFATLCGYVIAVDEPRFAQSKKSPTCIRCVVPHV